MRLFDRRSFLKQAGSLAVAWRVAPTQTASQRETLLNPVGYHTIAWPRSQFDEALTTISQLDFKGVQMLGWVRDAHRGRRAGELRERLAALHLQPVTLSCSKIDLDPDRPKDESGELRAYAAFFRALGGLYLQVTDGGKPEREYSAPVIQALGARMNALGRVAQDSGLVLGYHPHFNTLGETREGLGRMLEATDPRYVKLIADVGHLAMGGADPTEIVCTYHERMIFLHFKDVRRDVAELVRKDRNLVRGNGYKFCEIGTGAVDFSRVVQALHDLRFPGWIIVELDGNEPPPGGPAESARINKGALQRLGLSI